MTSNSPVLQFEIWPLGSEKPFQSSSVFDTKEYLLDQLEAWDHLRKTFNDPNAIEFASFECSKIKKIITQVEAIARRPASNAANNATLGYIASNLQYRENIWIDASSKLGLKTIGMLSKGFWDDLKVVLSTARAERGIISEPDENDNDDAQDPNLLKSGLHKQRFEISTAQNSDNVGRDHKRSLQDKFDSFSRELSNLNHELSSEASSLRIQIESMKEALDSIENDRRRLSENVAVSAGALEAERKKLFGRAESISNEVNAMFISTKENVEREVNIINKNQKDLMAKYNEILLDIRGDLDAFKNQYEEKVRLNKPTQYWRAKAKNHRITSVAALAGFVTFIIALFYSAYSNFDIIWTIIGEIQINSHNSISLFGVAIISVPTILVFWILKHISRIYVENAHFAADAAQRSVMMQTYLALVGDPSSGVTDKERMLVLHSLFRPSASASADDAPPSGMWEVLSKLGDAKKDK